MQGLNHTQEWLRIGDDMVFLLAGAVPLAVAIGKRVLDHRPDEA